MIVSSLGGLSGADGARPTHHHKSLGADGSDRMLRRVGGQIREIVL